MMKVTGDATRIIAVLKVRIVGNAVAGGHEGGPLGKGTRREGEEGTVAKGSERVGARSSWRKGIYCPLHHFTGS